MVSAFSSFSSVQFIVVDGVGKHDVDDDGRARGAEAHDAKGQTKRYSTGCIESEVGHETADANDGDGQTVRFQLPVASNL